MFKGRFFQGAILLFVLVITLAGFIFFENKPVVVENQKVSLSYYLNGGILKSFSLKSIDFNPYQISKDTTESIGQILSLATSTQRAQDEILKAKALAWELQNSPIQKGQNMEMMLRGELLNEKLTVKKWVTLPLSESFVHVKEDVFNYGDATSKIDFSQILTLNPAFIRDTEIFSNMDVKSESRLSFKKANDSGDLKWIVLYNHPNNIIYGFIFLNNSYTNIFFGNGKSPYLKLSGESEAVSIGSKTMISKSYCSFLMMADKTLKDVRTVELRGNQFYLIGNGSQQILLGSIKPS